MPKSYLFGVTVVKINVWRLVKAKVRGEVYTVNDAESLLGIENSSRGLMM